MLSLNSLKKLYYDSPLWMKKLYASIPYNIRNGSDYRKYKKFIETNIDIEAYEIMKLKETLLYAYDNTVYYKKLFDMLQVHPYEVNDRKDLELFPLIDKDIVRKNFNDMIVQNYPRQRTFFVSTGGSSGQPMKFLQSRNVWNKELAFDTVYFKKFGYYPMMPRASFRGGEFNIKNNIYWHVNPMYNEVHFSPYHLNASTVKYYAEELNTLELEMYLTYPSSLLLLIDSLNANNIVLNKYPKLIVLISEMTNSYEIEKMSNYFKSSKIIAFYGHSERLIFGVSDNKLLKNYKIDRRYGFMELIDREDKCIYENYKNGEMVGTSYDNWVMPLIRYKTGDFTEYINVNKCITNHINGRKQDYLQGYNGSKVFLTAINMHSEVFKNVLQFQFIQENIGEAKLLVLPDKKFTFKDEKLILQALYKMVGKKMNFSMRCVDQLIMTPRGKVKRIIKQGEIV